MRDDGEGRGVKGRGVRGRGVRGGRVTELQK